MGDDIEMGAINNAGAQTNLFAEVNPDGSWPGDFVFNVEAKVLADRTINGIRAVGQVWTGEAALGPAIAPGGLGVVGIGAVGVVGQGTVGVVGQVGISDFLPPFPADFDNTGVLGSSFGDAQAAGVIGESDAGYGVYGVTQGGVGVRGDSLNVGVIGEGANNVGVIGVGGEIGVQGMTGLDGTGVLASVSGGIGVHGVASNSVNSIGAGVVGEGEGGIGVSGRVTGPAGTGVEALSSGINGMALYASDWDDHGREVGQAAGWFDGRVVVDGDLVIFGAKHAAVRQRDGSHRMLYSMESPENWFEDFGEGQLVKGKARVKLEPGFASLVKADSFHVFLTPYGDSNGLYVSQRGKQGFEVREQGNGKASLPFSYRIVARRKDIKGERLAKIAITKVGPRKIVSKAPRKLGELAAPPKRRGTSVRNRHSGSHR